MTTAQVLFEQYKVLPPRIRKELKELIDKETKDVTEEDDDDSGDTIRMAVEPLKEGIRELKLVLSGKLKARPAREMLEEIEKELANER